MKQGTSPVSQVKYMWHTLFGGVAKDVILKARVDDELASAVDEWAEEHDTDRSEVIRRALGAFLEDAEARRERIEEARKRIDDLADTGIFEPPEDNAWRVGGFR